MLAPLVGLSRPPGKCAPLFEKRCAQGISSRNWIKTSRRNTMWYYTENSSDNRYGSRISGIRQQRQHLLKFPFVPGLETHFQANRTLQEARERVRIYLWAFQAF
ncbi:hypothetical protein TNCV_924731 [Trichonephila clavipes]|nr:hypothetical protein TNCV_924731 [Trichonephila clavipes]